MPSSAALFFPIGDDRMIRISVSRSTCMVVALALVVGLVLPSLMQAQLLSFPKQDLVDYTSQNPFDRLQDGRPKVPDDLMERARGLSSEEVWAVLEEKGFRNQ